METAKRVLIVEDEEDILTAWRTALEQKGYVVETADSADEALIVIKENDIDLVLTDIVMPGRDGIELTSLIKESNPEIKILAVSGGGGKLGLPEELLERAMDNGADFVLCKPIRLAELLGAIHRVLVVDSV